MTNDFGSAGTGQYVDTGRTVNAERPIEWLKQGWGIFMKNPGMWIGIAVAFIVITIVLGMVPIIGQLAVNLVAPVFGAGLLLGCRELAAGKELRFDHLFAGFKQNTGNLILVGVLYAVGTAAIMLLAFLVGGGAALTGAVTGNGIGAGIAAGGVLLAMLLLLVLMVPLIMAIWYAPALVVFHNVPPVAAMKNSFAASLKNMVPFLIYGLILLVLSIVASIPLLLGWLVLFPVLVGAHYTSYLDIFE